jgi:hypothetical protein
MSMTDGILRAQIDNVRVRVFDKSISLESVFQRLSEVSGCEVRIGSMDVQYGEPEYRPAPAAEPQFLNVIPGPDGRLPAGARRGVYRIKPSSAGGFTATWERDLTDEELARAEARMEDDNLDDCGED